MHEYDVAFKLVLQSVDLAIRELAGGLVARWLSVELPEVRNTRVDPLGEMENGELVHIELQSTNEPQMRCGCGVLPARAAAVREVSAPGSGLRREPALSMEAELNGPALRYSYRLVDIRELNGERLLERARG